MPTILTNCILEPANHLTRDRTVTTAVFNSPTGDVASVVEAAFDRWERFFNTAHDGTVAVCTYISSTMARTAGNCLLRAYELDTAGIAGGPLGSPVGTRTWTLGAVGAGTSPYPHEVAACVSFHADVTDVPQEDVTGRPASRRRGRFYVGPLNSSSGAASPDGMWRLSPAFIASLAAAATFLAVPDPLEPADSSNLMVWSRKDQSVRLIQGGHVDNEFDTQRRRGLDSSSRTLWTALG